MQQIRPWLMQRTFFTGKVIIYLNVRIFQEVVKYQNQRDAETLAGYFTNQDPDIRARAAFAMASVPDSHGAGGSCFPAE